VPGSGQSTSGAAGGCKYAETANPAALLRFGERDGRAAGAGLAGRRRGRCGARAGPGGQFVEALASDPRQHCVVKLAPDIGLGRAERFFADEAEGALVAGVSIPLGVFDRNQGAVARARAEQRRAELELEAGRRTLSREYAALERAIATDAAAVQSTEDTVIPQAERALSLAQDGYNRGAFSYLDVLEAQLIDPVSFVGSDKVVMTAAAVKIVEERLK